MFIHETRVRVRYAETDQMGQMYYGRYAELFEVGRVEALRSLGFPYRRIEDDGVLLPVRDLHVRYHRPVRYDDEVIVRTAIVALPEARITFRYALIDAAGALLTEGETTLVFVDRATRRPCRAPGDLVAALAPHFP
ncbi:MAG: thioesterase family protein [Flavobacteriales bacterium]|jgi:acyl-CoA thioester hydrolase|nr:MAG: thioesterase family protein [Flavobacteriales bacterium]